MSGISRRTMITRGLAAAAGLTGLAAAERLADRYGLIPPDAGGLYGPGGTRTYAAQRLMTRASLAREFNRSQISNPPFANETRPPSDQFTRLQANGFTDWRVSGGGVGGPPASLSPARAGGPRAPGSLRSRCRSRWPTSSDSRCGGRSPRSPAKKAGPTWRSGRE